MPGTCLAKFIISFVLCCTTGSSSPSKSSSVVRSPYDYENKFLQLLTTSNSQVSASGAVNKFFRVYTRSFFAPAAPFQPDLVSVAGATTKTAKVALPRSYHVQMDHPPGRNEPARRNPDVFRRAGAMRVDFHTLEDNKDPDAEFTTNLHRMEAKMRGQEKLPDLAVHAGTLRFTLEEVLSLPRNQASHPEHREAVGSYLYGRFGRSGLLTHMHSFQAERPGIDSSKMKTLKHPPGANIIGVLPGTYWGTSRDRPVVVAAHWDTVPNTPGYNDNGSGVSVMLEAASTLSRARCLHNRHSVIFVALDQEEQGCLGSLEFVRSYLAPDFPRGIQGAYVLDTVANFAGARRGSQTVPEDWERLAPEAARSIREHGEKGDFIGVVTRSASSSERRLAESFSRFHRRLLPRQFRLEHFSLRGLPVDRMPDNGELFEHRYFWRSDNARFWYHQEKEEGKEEKADAWEATGNSNNYTTFRSMGAALITDTAFHRGYMRRCYHQPCDFPGNPELEPEGLYFLSKTAQALVLAVAELAEGLDGCDLAPINLQDEEEEEEGKSGGEDLNTRVENEDGEADAAATPRKEGDGGGLPREDVEGGEDAHRKALTKVMLAATLGRIHHQSPAEESPPPQPPRGPLVHLNGPFQPNFGSQYNIGHLTVQVSEREKRRRPSSVEEPKRDDSYALLLPGEVDHAAREGESVQKKLVEYLKEVWREMSPRRSEKNGFKNSPMLIKLSTG